MYVQAVNDDDREFDREQESSVRDSNELEHGGDNNIEEGDIFGESDDMADDGQEQRGDKSVSESSEDLAKDTVKRKKEKSKPFGVVFMVVFVLLFVLLFVLVFVSLFVSLFVLLFVYDSTHVVAGNLPIKFARQWQTIICKRILLILFVCIEFLLMM